MAPFPPVTFRLWQVLLAAAAALLLAFLLLGCGGSTERPPETLQTAAGAPVELCWQGCFYVEGPGLEVNGEPTEGCFWNNQPDEACVELVTPVDAVLVVDRESCRESCR